ncbi:response regulator transcription factor [Methylobacterium sp. EM32]|uniref:response regulator transcription factor n=1 Tax=Methylobacterium sp. EM32 TaxID=3163481 RepID=UPI0033BACB7F
MLIADDHPVFLAGIYMLLTKAADIEIVGEANTGRRALALILETRPDIALLDISMPEMHGIAVTKRLVSEAVPTHVVLLSAHDDPTYVRQALGAGARGYVLKNSAGDNLTQAIRAVSNGGLYLDPAIAERCLPASDLVGPRTSGSVERGALPLTDRERDVIRLIALGFTNKEVAAKLGVTTKSVETYKTRASEKLDLRSRSKIVQYAILQGWYHNVL